MQKDWEVSGICNIMRRLEGNEYIYLINSPGTEPDGYSFGGYAKMLNFTRLSTEIA